MIQYLSLGATAAIILCFTYTLGMYLEGRTAQPEPARTTPDLLFVYLIPCLNEERVITATLERLAQTAPHNFMVVVVDDGSDDRTAALVQERASERVVLLQRRLPDARRGKGAALNAAVDYLAGHPVVQSHPASDVIICLLDADGRIDGDAANTISGHFGDPRVGGVQIAVRIGNRDQGLLPRLQDMEFVCYTELFQRCRSRGGFAGLGGNGQFTRLSALQALDGAPWAPEILTEDLDLGIRLLQAGWRLKYAPDASVNQQGLLSLVALVRQRSRWFQGLLQCWRLIPGVTRRTGGRLRLDLLHMLLSPFLIFAAFLMTLSFIAAPVEWLLGTSTTWGGPSSKTAAAWYLLTFFPAFLFALAYGRVSGVKKLTAFALGHAFVLYGMLWVAAGTRAIWRMVRGRNGWLKTERLRERSRPSWMPVKPRRLQSPASGAQNWDWKLPADGGLADRRRPERAAGRPRWASWWPPVRLPGSDARISEDWSWGLPAGPTSQRMRGEIHGQAHDADLRDASRSHQDGSGRP